MSIKLGRKWGKIYKNKNTPAESPCSYEHSALLPAENTVSDVREIRTGAAAVQHVRQLGLIAFLAV